MTATPPEDVIDRVLGLDESSDLLKLRERRSKLKHLTQTSYLAALRPVLEGYRREGKYYATLAIGCTGGKHRSVAVTEEIARRLGELPDVNVNVQHRDKGRE